MTDESTPAVVAGDAVAHQSLLAPQLAHPRSKPRAHAPHCAPELVDGGLCRQAGVSEGVRATQGCRGPGKEGRPVSRLSPPRSACATDLSSTGSLHPLLYKAQCMAINLLTCRYMRACVSTAASSMSWDVRCTKLTATDAWSPSPDTQTLLGGGSSAAGSMGKLLGSMCERPSGIYKDGGMAGGMVSEW